MTLSNIKRVPVAMGVELIMGDYSHTLSDATNESIVVSAGRIYFACAHPASATQTDADAVGFSESISGQNNTVTLNTSLTTTAGRFFIVVGTG